MTEQEAIDALEEHKKLIDKEYLKTRNSKSKRQDKTLSRITR